MFYSSNISDVLPLSWVTISSICQISCDSFTLNTRCDYVMLIIVFTNIIAVKKRSDNLSFKSKNSFLKEFFNELGKLNNVNSQK